MSSPTPAHLAFDDVVIDFAGGRLWRGGAVRPLEPKAFGVLALLAGSPGRLFSRDEILDAVWGHAHVTPGTLNRVVTLLRQALGEDAQHPRLLHTVHGTGYRFDLPAHAPPPRSDDAAASAVVGEDPADGHGTAAPETPRRPMVRASRWRFLLLGVLAAAAAGWWWRESRSPPAPPPPAADARPATLVVMPLKPIGDAPGVGVVADGLSEELISSLARIDGLRVIAHESTRLAAADAADPARLVQRLGISHALEGSLQQAGERLRIRLRLVEATGGRTLWVRDFDRDAAEVLDLQREIAEAVATALALRMGLAPDSSGPGGDAGYLQRFLAAQALMRNPGAGSRENAETAEAAYRALIRERPDDARVRASLLMALELRAYRSPPLAQMLRAEIAQEAELVQRLDPALYESWYVQGTSACRANDWERCLALLEKARTLAPGEVMPRGYYGYALLQLGYLDRGEAVHRDLLASDPINPDRSFNLARTLDTQGRHEEALAYFDPANPFHVYGRWFNAVWRRDHAAALHIAEHEIGGNAQQDSTAVVLQPTYIATSRALVDPALWPQAEAEMVRFERETGLLNFCRVLAPEAPAQAGDLIRRLDELRKRAYSSWDLLLWTRDLPWLRRDPAFQDYLRDNGILAYWRAHGFPAQCRPQGHGAACD